MTHSTETRSPRSWSRIDGVDCLRALAIFYVLMNHVNMRLLFTKLHYLRDVPQPLATALVWQGQAGVQIFFAVSGYLITATSIRRWGELHKVNPRDFYVLRFARIAPLFLALLALLSLLDLLHLKDFVIPNSAGGLKAALWAALTFRVGLLQATKGYLPGSWDILWSLSVEETFYIGFPLACRLLGRGKGLVALLATFVFLGPLGRTVLTHGNEVWREYSYLGGMDAIALGCLTALFLSRRSISRTTVACLAFAGLSVLGFCLCFSREVYKLGLYKTGLSMTVLAIGTCMLIAAAAESQWHAPRSLLPLLTLGRRSYEIYLTHMFLVFLCFNLFMQDTGRSMRLVPLLFLAAIASSGVLGELVGRFYSEPANRWLRTRFGDGPERLGSLASTEHPQAAALP